MSRGKHVASRPHGRKTRTFGRAVPLALALVMVMAGVALADHAMTLSFDPSSPVTAGADVTVKGERNDGETQQGSLGNRLEIWQCFLPGDIPAPWEVCEQENPDTDVIDGAWVRQAFVDTSETVTEVTYVFETEGLGGTTAGFKAEWNPAQSGGHPDSIDFGNLVINVPSSGASHPGCNGIENAYEQVTTNNGASQGKGAQSLEKVAEKLGCSLASA